MKEAERLARLTEALIGDDYMRSKFLWLRARLRQRLGEPEAGPRNVGGRARHLTMCLQARA